jgi:hypothetical protein
MNGYAALALICMSLALGAMAFTHLVRARTTKRLFGVIDKQNKTIDLLNESLDIQQDSINKLKEIADEKDRIAILKQMTGVDHNG